MHHVLEAKLVVGNMVFSIGTEFIENENEEVTKQDCELKAFHRLAKLFACKIAWEDSFEIKPIPDSQYVYWVIAFMPVKECLSAVMTINGSIYSDLKKAESRV
jgi:hypothetical protein